MIQIVKSNCGLDLDPCTLEDIESIFEFYEEIAAQIDKGSHAENIEVSINILFEIWEFIQNDHVSCEIFLQLIKHYAESIKELHKLIQKIRGINISSTNYMQENNFCIENIPKFNLKNEQNKFLKFLEREPKKALSLYEENHLKLKGLELPQWLLNYQDSCFIQKMDLLYNLLKEFEKLKANPVNPQSEAYNLYNILYKMKSFDYEIFDKFLQVNRDDQLLIQNSGVLYNLSEKKILEDMNKIADTISPDMCSNRICLEDFNVVSFRKSKEEQNNLIRDWIQNFEKPGSLKTILPLYYNLLKRGEDWEDFVQCVNKFIIEFQLSSKLGTFTKKFLFYLLYSHSERELQVRLLQMYGFYNSVPFTYPVFANSRNSAGFTYVKYIRNSDIYFIAQESLGIFSFGFGELATMKCGKSKILNTVFEKNFQTDDSSPFSTNTIDIDNDGSIYPSRNWFIADSHGKTQEDLVIPFIKHCKILLIHIHSKNLEDPNFQQSLINLEVNLKQTMINNNIIVLIRDADLVVKDYHIDPKKIVKSNFIVSSRDYLTDKYKVLKDLSINNNIEFLAISNLNNLSDVLAKNTLIQIQKVVLSICYKNLNSNKKLIPLSLFKSLKCSENIEIIEKHVITIINSLKDSGQNYFNPQIFPARVLLKKFRINIQRLKKERDHLALTAIYNDQKKIENDLQNLTPSKIIKEFLEILKHPSYFLICLKLSTALKNLSIQNTRKLMEDKKSLLEELKNKYGIDIVTLADDSMQKYNQNWEVSLKIKRLHELNQFIDQRIISIEIIWRELMTINHHSKNKIDFVLGINNILLDFLKKGEPLELIDGDNLQFNEGAIKNIFENLKNNKVVTLAVIGPQSSGKSTLLNYLFGCQFASSVGRCTRGIYMSLMKINNPHYDYMLVLDSEGLQSPEKNDDEFDRKITLFLLAVSQLIIVNIKGDLHLPMRRLLEICVLSLNELKKSKIKEPDVFLCFNQNQSSEKYPFIKQVSKMMQEIIAANPEAKEVAKILESREENLFILGFAYFTKHIEKDLSKGIEAEWKALYPQSSFASECSILAHAICNEITKRSERLIKDKNVNYYTYSEFDAWINMANENWQTIDAFPDLVEYSEVRQIRQIQDLRVFIQGTEKRLMNSTYQFSLEDELNEEIKRMKKKLNPKLLDEIDSKLESKIKENYNNFKNELTENINSYQKSKRIQWELTKKQLDNADLRIDSYEREMRSNLKSLCKEKLVETSKKDEMIFVMEKIKQFAKLVNEAPNEQEREKEKIAARSNFELF